MNQAINDNPCVCCGEYAVEGSWLCWRCQHGLPINKTAKDYFIEKNNKKHLTKRVGYDIIQILQTKQHKIITKQGD